MSGSASHVIQEGWGYRMRAEGGALVFEKTGSFGAGVVAMVAGVVAFILAANGALQLAVGGPDMRLVAIGLLVGSFVAAAGCAVLARVARRAGKEPLRIATIDTQARTFTVHASGAVVPVDAVRLVSRRNWLWRGVGIRDYLDADLPGARVRLGGTSEHEGTLRLILHVERALASGAARGLPDGRGVSPTKASDAAVPARR